MTTLERTVEQVRGLLREVYPAGLSIPQLAEYTKRGTPASSKEAARRAVKTLLAGHVATAREGRDGNAKAATYFLLDGSGAPVMEVRKARSTGATVRLLDNRSGDLGEGDTWVILCTRHGQTMSGTSRRTVRSFIGRPEEWCDGCRGAHGA